MKGWTPQGREVELSPWQERAVRALLDGRHQQVLIVRGRQWGWSTVLETARRYDLFPALLHGQARRARRLRRGRYRGTAGGVTGGVLSAFGLHNPAGPDEEPPLWAFTPQLRISGLLAWQARRGGRDDSRGRLRSDRADGDLRLAGIPPCLPADAVASGRRLGQRGRLRLLRRGVARLRQVAVALRTTTPHCAHQPPMTRVPGWGSAPACLPGAVRPEIRVFLRGVPSGAGSSRR